MARWDPGTEKRLIKAALELYAEHGYDNVTVTRIAEHAGITRRSYFRYFPDKREVLFAGSERLPAAIEQAVLAAAETSSPLSTALDALAGVGARLVEHVTNVAERRAVINASAELQERERTKVAAVTAAIRTGLEQRGTETGRAHLVAQIATVVFQNAFDQWAGADGHTDFVTCLQAAAASLRDAVTADSTNGTPG
ncbi:helix-turn-helix domain-containing protein [Streptomyces sp. Li-HN-5-11]|uniref:TetR/AcrR family transcriptional regulator n=1 Tax=Streptomyces sp. Li-HN-5-11 TaxID=3075432 RepID=UPI0028A5E1F3|nr:helix-turn-helix domain-containing protein [Streptomyces sp. Li-HN-5-11]WNM36138.1 helix-turn-helix domain-containing protein [Streptomyces sp. Li-HN-5-11]